MTVGSARVEQWPALKAKPMRRMDGEEIFQSKVVPLLSLTLLSFTAMPSIPRLAVIIMELYPVIVFLLS